VRKRRRADQLNLKARVDTRDAARNAVTRPGDAAIIVRGRARSIVMACPCGCGDHLTINLDPRSGPAWRLIQRRGKLTLYPSVWRESRCRSHFVVWQNEIYLFGRNEFDHRRHPKLEECVYQQLADGRPRHFSDIADSLGELPWSVLVACENLVSEGKINELEKPDGRFIRPPRPSNIHVVERTS